MTVTPVLLGERISGVLIVFRDITDEVEFDRRKSEFISIASHQLRSPISALKWLTDMLRKGDLGPLAQKQKEWIDKIFVSAEKMNLLVNELLNVSRMESGVTTLNITPSDAGKFVRDTMTEEEPLLAEKKQTYAHDAKELGTVDMDVLMMGEVFKNFISNASKYSPEGGEIAVAAVVHDGMFQVSVKDSGIGIPKADQTQMFNKFFRAANAVQSPNKGTGLGLYMAKSTVERHGGEIGFDSEGEGKGSTFWFRIPVKNAAADRKESVTEEVRKASKT
jgi:signal transduction histidine kinase